MLKEVRELILADKIEKAFQTLEGNKQYGKNFTIQIDVLHSRYNRYKKVRAMGTQSFENINLEANQICLSLLDVVSSAKDIFKDKSKEERIVWKDQFTIAIKDFERKMLEINKQLKPKKNHGRKQYLVSWLVENFEQLNAETTRLTFDILKEENKDFFDFEVSIGFVLRFILKSYLYNSNEWLKEPGFIFDFKVFTKTEMRVALLILKNVLLQDDDLLLKDKIELIDRLDLLDKGIKDY